MVLTPGKINGTAMLADTLDRIRAPGPGLYPHTRPDRVLSDKGYPSRANRAYLAPRGIKSTILDRDDQKKHRANRGSAVGRSSLYAARIYQGHNVVERSFNRLKNWRGIAMHSDKTVRTNQACVTLAAAL